MTNRRRRVRVGLAAFVAVAALGSRAHAASAPPFTIEIDHAQAIFQLGNLAPGALGSRCLVLTIRNGAADAALLSATVGGTGLAAFLDVTVDVGTSADPAACTDFAGTTAYTGTVSDLGNTHATPATAVPLPFADGRSAVIRIALALRDDNAAQGLAATLSLRFDAVDTSAPPSTTTTAVTATTTTSATTADTTTAASTTTTAVVGGSGARRPSGPRIEQPGEFDGPSATSAVATTTPSPPLPAGEIEVRDPTQTDDTRSVAEQAVEAVTATVAVAAQTSSVPAVFVGAIVVFLVVQDRFDRNDPKLARAPFAPEAELIFVRRQPERPR